MAIFGKKITTAEMLLKALNDLSDEERTKFEQSLKDRVDESVGAQEEADNEQDTQSAEDRVDESVGAENANADENADDVVKESTDDTNVEETEDTDVPTNEEVATAEDEKYKALLARIDAQDAQIASLMTAFGEIGELKDKSENFGATEVGDNVDTSDEQRDDDRIMANFYGSSYRK